MIHAWLLAALLTVATALPARAEDPIALALSHRRQHRFQAAEQVLASVLARSPDHLEANLQMGYLKQQLGELKACLPYMQHAAAAHPGDLEAQVMLAHAYLWCDRFDEAERQAERTLAAWEGKRPDPTLWAKLLVVQGAVQGLKAKREGLWAALKYGMAVRGTFERAYALDPEGFVPAYALSRYYLEAPAVAGGDAKKGLSLLRKAIRRAPENFGARAYYLQALVKCGSEGEAREELAAYRKAFGHVPVAMAAIQSIADRLP